MVQSDYGTVLVDVAPIRHHNRNRKLLVAIGASCLVAMALVLVVTLVGDAWGQTPEIVLDHDSSEVASAILEHSGVLKSNAAVSKSIAQSAEQAATEVQHGLKASVKLSPLSAKLQKMLKQAQAEINIEKSIKLKKAKAQALKQKSTKKAAA
eukprot:CAMPEP_0114546744 /NCGR_PEP_ID=MMETSP0114-20121206/4094_1 /TAXON_ID=31324 /ORGANISM="Goniomonas sp, Strain m" /LENGTH=151 /DNA_ID=CAMNT_0001731253 /DNA_START=26 /DNA_END=481 /DNA_ORIENTATION=-